MRMGSRLIRYNRGQNHNAIHAICHHWIPVSELRMDAHCPKCFVFTIRERGQKRGQERNYAILLRMAASMLVFCFCETLQSSSNLIS